MNHSCPYCHSDDTSPLRKILGLVEYICNKCACTFNVEEE